MHNESPFTLSIDADGRGAWELVVSRGRDHVPCATLEEAKRHAYRCAARRRPCEVIVRDAYHRVIDRELIDTDPRHSDPSGAGG